LSSNGLTSAHDQLKEWAQGDLTCETSYSGQNFRETRVYEVKDGGLNVRSKSKTSWADSRRTDTYRCSADSEETKRFLRNNRDDLDTDGIE
jgi:intein-encoded DNA endonuclease-like protein